MASDNVAKRGVRALCGIVLLMMTVEATASVSYEVLATLQKPGTQTRAPLVLHSDGNFYGTASSNGARSLGTIFKMTPAGVITTLHSFNGGDGAGPVCGLVEGVDHELYGTAPSGGSTGFGTIFRISTTGAFTKILDFTGSAGAAPGSVPHALMLHADGYFYGVTQAGGANGFGTVFKLTAAGVITTLAEFTGNGGTRPGRQPVGPLVASGNLIYGVTTFGGVSGLGQIFEISTTGAWRSMADFTGVTGLRPGANAAGGLLMNTDGALYGATEFGGTSSQGVAFKLTTSVTPVFTVLRHFADASGGQPAGALARGSDGALYGQTAAGGASGLGTAYRITTGGVHTVLVHFSGESGAFPGSAPRGGFVVGADGQFYSVTSAGSAGNAGQAFKVSTAGAFTALASLSLPPGWSPSGAPVVAASGALLFPVAQGGAAGGGNVMSFTTGGGLTVAAALGGTLGTMPDGALRSAGSNFYGVTARGGASNRGTLFRYTVGVGNTLVVAYSTSAGSLAEGPLTLGADGLYYGVGREGGASSRGAIYKVTTTGIRTRLISFSGTAGAAPGGRPCGPLVLAADGNFYGLTEEGGASNTGVIFRLTPAGSYTVLHQFGSTGPRLPMGGWAVGADGLLYGTTSLGGTADAGTLIRFNPTTSTLELLGEFTGSAGAVPGQVPAGELTTGPDGAIYGATLGGGAADEGTIFRYKNGTGLQSLTQFTGAAGAAPGSAADTDGAGLNFTGGLVIGADGKLYGVAGGGGSEGGGVIYRLNISAPLSDWKLAYLGDVNAPDLEDSDHDGMANLLEYGLLTLPGTADAASTPGGSISSFPDNDRLALAVPRDPSRTDITIHVEVSDTLEALSWINLATSTQGGVFTGPGYYSGDADTPGIKLVTIRDIIPASGAGRRFVRVRVTR